MKQPATLATLAAIGLALAAIAFADGYQIYILTLVGLTATVGVGLNIPLGLTGQISLGHVGFYAIGAYTVPRRHGHCAGGRAGACNRRAGGRGDPGRA